MHMLIMHTINHYRESGSSTGTSLCVMSWLTLSGMSMMRLSVTTLLTLLCSIAEHFMLYVTVRHVRVHIELTTQGCHRLY